MTVFGFVEGSWGWQGFPMTLYGRVLGEDDPWAFVIIENAYGSITFALTRPNPNHPFPDYHIQYYKVNVD
jgi:hypothetical protein